MFSSLFPILPNIYISKNKKLNLNFLNFIKHMLIAYSHEESVSGGMTSVCEIENAADKKNQAQGE